MGVKRIVGSIANSILSRFGFQIIRMSDDFTLPGALARLASRSMNIETVIDIGASNGIWSKRAMAFFPNSSYLLIEANPVHKDSLELFTRKNPSAEYTLQAAGDLVGEIYFDATDPQGGAASHTADTLNSDAKIIRVPVTTVDDQVKERNLKPPFLLKLDTHGFEAQIISGAAETLKQTDIIVVETYNFKLLDGCLRFHQLCAFLEDRGFRVIDIIDLLLRPRDQVLWQFDLVFARSDRPEFAYNKWE